MSREYYREDRSVLVVSVEGLTESVCCYWAILPFGTQYSSRGGRRQRVLAEIVDGCIRSKDFKPQDSACGFQAVQVEYYG